MGKNFSALLNSTRAAIFSVPIWTVFRRPFKSCVGGFRYGAPPLPRYRRIHLTERVPVAHWRSGGLVDTKGNVFNAKLKAKLPVFEGQPGTGRDMVKHYEEFSGILRRQNLAIKELIYTPRSAWLVVLDNGITVRTGKGKRNQTLYSFSPKFGQRC